MHSLVLEVCGWALTVVCFSLFFSVLSLDVFSVYAAFMRWEGGLEGLRPLEYITLGLDNLPLVYMLVCRLVWYVG